MQNPAGRFLPIAALMVWATVVAGCSVSQLGFTDESGDTTVPEVSGAEPVIDDGAAAGDELEPEADPTPESETEPAGQPEADPGGVERRLSTDPDVDYAVGSCHGPPFAGAEPVELPCDEPHTIEVYAVGRLPGESGAPFQGLETAIALCNQDFLAITGVQIGLGTVFERSVLRPSEETWADGERAVTCYVAYPEPTTDRLAELDPVRSFGRVSVYGLRLGDCLVDFGDSDTTFTLAPCDTPHDAEVFVEYPVPEPEFPGEAEIDAIADELCFGQSFEDFVGTAYDRSALFSLRSRPSAETWPLGDRTINCILTDELVRAESFAGSGL